MNWRLASRLSVVTLAILVVILVAIVQQHKTASTGSQPASNSAAPATSQLQGTDLGSPPAPDFRLTDQFGRSVALSQFKGKPVVLTFLFTHCPDQCPLTAEKLHSTVQDLGKDAQNVGIIAVSTDPRRDTVAAAMNFSQVHSMQNSWHYLVGTHNMLEPVWSNYHIDAQSQQQMVNHNLGLYLIDKQGRERIFLGSDFTPAQLAHDLQVLMQE